MFHRNPGSLRQSVWPFIFLGLLSCDSVTSIRKLGPIDAVPNSDCVLTLLSSEESLSHIRHERVGQQTAWSLWEGNITTPPYDQYRFNTKIGYGGLSIKRGVGDAKIEVYFNRMNQDFTAEQRDFAEQLSASLIQILHDSCGNPQN